MSFERISSCLGNSYICSQRINAKSVLSKVTDLWSLTLWILIWTLHWIWSYHVRNVHGCRFSKPCTRPLAPRWVFSYVLTSLCKEPTKHLCLFFLAYPTKFSQIFTRSGYFRLIPGGVRRPHVWRHDVVDRGRTEHFLPIEKLKYNRRRGARKRIYNGCSVRTETSVTRDKGPTIWFSGAGAGRLFFFFVFFVFFFLKLFFLFSSDRKPENLFSQSESQNFLFRTKQKQWRGIM